MAKLDWLIKVNCGFVLFCFNSQFTFNSGKPSDITSEMDRWSDFYNVALINSEQKVFFLLKMLLWTETII
jgi:hypothetical protein